MELLDSDDPIKGHLLRKSALQREQIEEDVRVISEKTEKIITNALIIGGALAATYFLVSTFSKSKPKKSKLKKVRLVKDEVAADHVVVESAEPETPGMLSQIGTALAAQVTPILLGFVQEKLTEFVQSQAAKNQKTDEHS